MTSAASSSALRVNAHTHVYSGLAPFGMPAPSPTPSNFVEILERVWWRLDRALDERSLRASARYYVAHAIDLGAVALLDHHESPAFIEGSLDTLADVCHDLGMPAVLCYGATERNGGFDEGRRGLAECARFIRDNDRPRVRGLVGLHASFTVGDELLREAGELCRELGVPLHTHLAEDRADVDDAIERGYEGPLQRMIALDALPPGSILAHGVHLSRDEVQLADAHGAWLVQNPRSNQGNGVGYPRALSASAHVALGTDGYPADMDAETNALHEAALENGDDRTATAARPGAGVQLAEIRLGQALPASILGPSALVRREIEDEARVEAARLWETMATL